jgi:arabinose-5-phosphate isomerase
MLNSKVNIKEKMLDLSKVPVVTIASTLKDALDKMTQLRLGIALVVDSDSKLLGVLTDGDLRRLLLTRQSPLPALLVTPAIEFGNKHPHTLQVDASVDEAKSLMVSREIWDLPVVTKDNKVVGLLHRHSLS